MGKDSSQAIQGVKPFSTSGIISPPPPPKSYKKNTNFVFLFCTPFLSDSQNIGATKVTLAVLLWKPTPLFSSLFPLRDQLWNRPGSRRNCPCLLCPLPKRRFRSFGTVNRECHFSGFAQHWGGVLRTQVRLHQSCHSALPASSARQSWYQRIHFFKETSSAFALEVLQTAWRKKWRKIQWFKQLKVKQTLLDSSFRKHRLQFGPWTQKSQIDMARKKPFQSEILEIAHNVWGLEQNHVTAKPLCFDGPRPRSPFVGD